MLHEHLKDVVSDEMRQHLILWVWGLSDLPSAEKLVLLFLVTISNDQRVINLSWEMITMTTCMAETDAKNAISTLLSRNLIKKSDENTYGMFHVKILYPDPYDVAHSLN